MRYYLDTNIWLNLFKKEGDTTKGTPFWQLAKELIDRVMFSQDDKIVYSGIVLRELQIKLGEEVYNVKKQWLDEEPSFIKVDVIQEDKTEARKLESKYGFEISFYDLLHMLICKRLDLILVTRDAQLIKIATETGVRANKPEEL